MRLLLFVQLSLLSITGFSQNKPSIYKKYIDNSDKFIIKTLTLSSDGYYFAVSSCECRKEYLSKGKWTMKKNKLILNSLPNDSFALYPKFKLINSNKKTDSITIKMINYYKQPLKVAISAMPILGKGNSDYKDVRLNLNDKGILRLSRLDFYGFLMEYELYRSDMKKGENLGVYFDSEYLDTVEISTDFYNAGYDRELIREQPQKNLTYIIKGNKLLFDNKKVAYVEDKNK